MALDVNEIAYLLPSDNQFLSYNGKPLTGGHIKVYLAGTDTKYITYQNFDYTENPFEILIPQDGRVVVLAEIENSYDYYVYDSYNNLVFSRLNVICNGTGGGSGGGVSKQYVDQHDNELQTQISAHSSQLRNVNSILGQHTYEIMSKQDILIQGDHIKIENNDDDEPVISAYGFADENDLVNEIISRTNSDRYIEGLISNKQDKLTPGTNIEITDDNTINAVGDLGKVYTSPEETILVDNDEETLESSKYYLDNVRTETSYTIGDYIEQSQIIINSNKIKFNIEEDVSNLYVSIEYRMYNTDGTSSPISQSIQGNNLLSEVTIPTNAFDMGLTSSYIRILGASSVIENNNNDKIITLSGYTYTKKEIQEKLVAGDNIGIDVDGKTISVVDKKELHVQSPITWDNESTTIGFDDTEYAKTTDIPTDFYTKSQTDNAISNAVSDKVTTTELNTVKGTLETSIGEVESQVISVSNSLSTNYYTKTQVDGFLQNWSGFVVVPLGEELPDPTTAQLGKIYLWKKADAQEKDNFEEWISDGSSWSKIGSMEIDLSNFYTKTESDSKYATITDYVGVTNAIRSLEENKLSSVVVDGTSITGDGTTDNPLVAHSTVSDSWNLVGTQNIIVLTDNTTDKTTSINLHQNVTDTINSLGNQVSELTTGLTYKQDKIEREIAVAVSSYEITNNTDSDMIVVVESYYVSFVDNPTNIWSTYRNGGLWHRCLSSTDIMTDVISPNSSMTISYKNINSEDLTCNVSVLKIKG